MAARSSLIVREPAERDLGAYAPWVAQVLLALLFLFAGGMKLVMPIGELADQSGMNGWFMRFIGTAEFAGAIGLALPGALRSWRALTPLAASGLTIIMTGATIVTVAQGDVAPAMLPFAVGVLCAFVAHQRRSWFTAA